MAEPVHSILDAYIAESDATSTWQQLNAIPPTGQLPSENIQDVYTDMGNIASMLSGGGEIYDEEGNVIAYGGSAPDLAFSPLVTKAGLLNLLKQSKKTGDIFKLFRGVENWDDAVKTLKKTLGGKIVTGGEKFSRGGGDVWVSPQKWKAEQYTGYPWGESSKGAVMEFDIPREWLLRNIKHSSQVEELGRTPWHSLPKETIERMKSMPPSEWKDLVMKRQSGRFGGAKLTKEDLDNFLEIQELIAKDIPSQFVKKVWKGPWGKHTGNPFYVEDFFRPKRTGLTEIQQQMEEMYKHILK